MNDTNTNGTDGTNDQAPVNQTPETQATPAAAAPTEATAAPADTSTAAPAQTTEPAPAMLKVTANGLIKGGVEVQIGTKVKDALRKISDSVVLSSLALRDALGEVIGMERTITKDLVLSVTAKSSGG